MSEVEVFINNIGSTEDPDCIIVREHPDCIDPKCAVIGSCWPEREIYYDETTGILSKKGLIFEASRMLKEYAEEGPQHEGYKPSIIVGDLDNFKEVNDRYGHQAGDRVLEAAAEIIKGTVREDDAFACRLHGDEFMVFAMTNDPDALMQRLYEAIGNDPWEVPTITGHSLSTLGIKASWGAVPYEGEEMNVESFEAAFEAADSAMYKDKDRRKKSTSMMQKAATYLSSLMPSIIHEEDDPFTSKPKRNSRQATYLPGCVFSQK